MQLKNNKIFRWVSIPICLALCFFGKFIPLSSSLSMDATGVIFIFLSCLFLWLTIGIDWPSLLCIISLAFLDSVGFSKAFSSSFGNSTFIFLLFTFVCTYALSKTSIIKRIAISFIDLKLAKKSGNCFVILFLCGVLFLGLFISPSVLFVIILPILEEIFELAGIKKEDKIAKALMLGLGFSVSISSGMTPISHVFPILALNAASIDVSPIQYMLVAIPTGLVVFLSMLLILLFIIRKDQKEFSNIDISKLKENLDRINKKDIITLIIFVSIIILWIVPSLFKDISPDFYLAINKYGTAMPPLLGALALCIIRVDNEPLIKIDKAFKEGIPWSSLIMCAATLVLGNVLTSDNIGLKDAISSFLSNSLANLPFILLVIIFTIWAALQTNVSSNMVTATLVATVAVSILSNYRDRDCFISLICIIGMMSSFAFATPPSMPHIAIVAGSEYCTSKDVLIFGSIMMILSIISCLLVAYPLGLLIF